MLGSGSGTWLNSGSAAVTLVAMVIVCLLLQDEHAALSI